MSNYAPLKSRPGIYVQTVEMFGGEWTPLRELLADGRREALLYMKRNGSRRYWFVFIHSDRVGYNWSWFAGKHAADKECLDILGVKPLRAVDLDEVC